jgi:general L-amino acid transport system permease protein
MDNRGIEFGFGFLTQESSFDVQFSLIDYDGSHSYARAYLVGLLNTLLVAFIGILISTILGVIVGIARLSPNYLIERTAAIYVEFFRNIPLLLQIFFWYFAALRALPLPQDADSIFGVSYLTIKGLYTPSFVWENLSIFFYSIIAAIISILVIRNYARKLQENQGKQLPVFSISIGLLIILPLLTFFIGGVSLDFEVPVLKQLSTTGFIYEGGLSIPPELIALTLALSLYTATFIAECVRAGIQGISKGQKEAAASIGLTPNQVLKLVIMPQALRIIIPPTTNQYLNLTKNSSLAAAIAYPDLVLVFAGTALMQTGRAIEIVSITMLTYLSISLSISVLMNWYNKRMAIKEK